MNLEKWINLCLKMSAKLMKRENGANRYLLANFSGTLQQKDIEDKTRLLDDFFRTKISVKAWVPEIAAKMGLEPVDFTDNQAVYESMIDGSNDIPLWGFSNLGCAPIQDFNYVSLFQIKGCNLHCPYCYVDDSNKNCRPGNGRFFSIDEILDLFESVRKEQPLHWLRSSGGEPTLVIDHWLEILYRLERRGLGETVIFRGDNNLTTGHYIDRLELLGLIPEHYRDRIAEFRNHQVLCGFKGTDPENYLGNVGYLTKKGKPNLKYAFLFDEQWYSFDRLVSAGINVEPYIYGPNPKTLAGFMREGERRYGSLFWLKVWLDAINIYGPTACRLVETGIDPEAYQKKLDENLAACENIMQDEIYRRFGLNYKAVPRFGIKLRITGR